MAENWMNEYVYDSIKYGTGMMRAATDGMKDMFKDADKVRGQYSKMRLNFGPPAPTAHELITRTNSDWVGLNPWTNWIQAIRYTDTEIHWLGRPNGHYQWGMDLASKEPGDWCATVLKKKGEINPK